MGEACPAIERLLPRDKVAIVRDGPRGCAVAMNGRTTVVDGFPRKPVDTNGAGTHTGIIVAEHALGTDWITAARRANAGAAIKVTRRGLRRPHRRRPGSTAFLAAEPRD